MAVLGPFVWTFLNRFFLGKLRDWNSGHGEKKGWAIHWVGERIRRCPVDLGEGRRFGSEVTQPKESNADCFVAMGIHASELVVKVGGVPLAFVPTPHKGTLRLKEKLE